MAINWDFADTKKNFEKKAKIPTRQIIAKNVAEMYNRADDMTPFDTGELRLSRRTFIGDTEGVFGYEKEYAPAVEYGTLHQRAQYYLKGNVDIQTPIFIQDLKDGMRDD